MRPALWTPTPGTADARDLYAHFLIDVEMSACQLTSRIKQALGSVQLFAQRCLMGLEGVSTDDSEWAQWSWMKNFRVWEANRKIWDYPENWIESQLRDDKSPFFKDLENELLQSELNDASAAQAFLHYLEKLDEVARLEMVGVYEDGDKTLHVFGRTPHVPYIHYYRRREGTTGTWTPWLKVEHDIDGDHLIPVTWNRRLMLIWPIFTEKAFPKDVEMPEPRGKVQPADHFWEIQLAWSEYQNGRWSGKNLSEAVTLEAYYQYKDDNNVLFGDPVTSPQDTTMRRYGNEPPEVDSLDDEIVIDPPPQNNDPEVTPRKLVPKALFSFKGLIPEDGDTLIVRGFLRRDYVNTKEPGNDQIAVCFGEFRFVGCRKIVTTAHRGYIGRSLLNCPLAPKNSKFDHMWFTGTGGGLTLFDGTFPVNLVTSVDTTNIRTQIHDDPSPSSELENKNDIPVLDRAPWSFRMLAPHQDLQFVCDRPFFFMDRRRAFLVSSTGSSGKITIHSHPIHSGWVLGDLAVAWRADYYPAPIRPWGPVVPTIPLSEELQPFTVLVRGSPGQRVAKTLTRVNLRPAFQPQTLIPKFWTTREYTFTNFHHPYLCKFVKILNEDGIPALLSLDTQRTADQHSFDAYSPTVRVLEPYPVDEVEFQTGGAYEQYNWELFFHIPLLIADQLSKNQRFEEAQRWFHFIFDPTGAAGGDTPQRYWRTKPFHERSAHDYEEEAVKKIEKTIAEGTSHEWDTAVAIWRNNPFSPHAVARLRTTAYQKTVVMNYIDNLIAWGDQLFRRETLESINEATHLYVLAAEILGRRPEVIQPKVKPAVHTFNSLSQIGLLGNTLEQVELLISNVGDHAPIGDSSETPALPSDRVLYFCVPENDKLLGYWNTVADRLFKIRHCMNIEGQVRQLPLFEPPIDPALLVRARAAGLSIAEVLSEINVPLPSYRFSVMAQKANELVAEVRNLGAALLSALEKRDAEALSTLRSGQELRLLQAIQDIRKKQIDEAESNIAALEQSRGMAQARKEYYESREFISTTEGIALGLSTLSLFPLEAKGTSELIAAVMHMIPTFKVGSATTAGSEAGGENKAKSSEAAGGKLETVATILNISSMLATRVAEYLRRQDEWDHQANLATIELKQIDQQLTAAQIRLAVAEQELRNHDQQIDNAREVDQFLRNKFTNQDLYQWMIGQVSGLYFQSYQLAYDVAKRAERCMQHELGFKEGETSYIRFGYWDSLKKGLMAADHLAHDLKRLDIAYLDGNIREYELTKHVSLRQLNPLALLELKAIGTCEVTLPEWLFDLDCPGHYMRRIKNVSLSIPSVTGPYTSVSCTLTLLKSSVRKSPLPKDDEYARRGSEDDRFVDYFGTIQSIVTSTGNNDSGMFETNLRDERYLPFEGAGAESTWNLELPADFRQFDYNTISDVILHVRYTARQGGAQLREKAVEYTQALIDEATTSGLVMFFSLRHDFPSEWHRFVTGNENFKAIVKKEYFPYFVQGQDKEITLNSVQLCAITDKEVQSTTPQGIDLAALTRNLNDNVSFELSLAPDGTVLVRDKEAHVFILIKYSVEQV